jgi:hypothetical protein
LEDLNPHEQQMYELDNAQGQGMRVCKVALTNLVSGTRDWWFSADGLIVKLPHSKTDQEGVCETKGIPYGSTPATCPARALRAWLDVAGIAEGAIFRPINRWGQLQPKPLTGHAVAELVKQLAERAGYDPAMFSGHSLRAGLATAAAAAGVAYHAIKNRPGIGLTRCCNAISGMDRCSARMPQQRLDSSQQ